MEKFKKFVKPISLSRKWENRIRRILEMSLMVVGICLVLAGFKDLLCLGGGILAIYVAYKGMVEDLPKFGVLNKRRFWE